MLPPPASHVSQVADFVRALAVAWKNIAAYPAGHPALKSSLDVAHKRLTELRGPAGEVVFGIAADALIYGKDRIESPHVQKFAQALFTRRVAVVRFANDTNDTDIETFLRLIAVNGDERTALWEQLTSEGVMNINLQPVDYSAVQVTDDLEAEKKKSETLWDDILRALVAGKELTPEGKRLLAANPRSVEELTSLVMKYIEDSGREMPQFDADATFGIRRIASAPDPPDLIRARVTQAIALHVGNAMGLKKQLAVQQVMQLLKTFPEPLRGSVLRSVLRELAKDDSTGSLLREFTDSIPDDDVLEALRYISTMGSISSHAVRLLESLSALADARAKAQQQPEIKKDVLLSELATFFGDDDIDRFNPPEHLTLLDKVSVQVPPEPSAATQPLGDRVDTVAPDAVNREFGMTVVELLAKQASDRKAVGRILSRVENVFLSFVSNGAFADAADFVDHVLAVRESYPEIRGEVDAALGHLATMESMRVLIDSALSMPAAQASVIQRLIESLGAAATRNLLESLAAENNRSRRRRLFDLVASLGPRIVDEAIPFLNDTRWFVVRNMIVLLRTVQDRSSLPQIRKIADHPDLRVRLEAIKTLLAFDASVPAGLLEKAIKDPDPKLAETAIGLVGSYGIKEAVGPLLEIVAGNDIFGVRRPLRVRAIKALGELADPRALPELARFFRRSFLPWPSLQERRAAYESLAGYPPDARGPFIEEGLKSRDATVREICKRLSGR